MSLANILKQTDIFFELSPTQMELIAALCQERRCNTGDVIFEENAGSDELYIIAQGEIEIQVDPALVGEGDEKGGGPVTIATLPAKRMETPFAKTLFDPQITQIHTDSSGAIPS